jgi:ATP-binding protein involved in chromosome partitioning
MLTQEQILDALRAVKYPGFSRDIVSFGLVREIGIDGAAVRVRMEVTTSDPNTARHIEEEGKKALAALPGIASVALTVDIKAPVQAAMQAGGLPRNDIPGIRHVVAVASGKGGVGKSTVAANLALALAKQGFKVGLCDCDLYGPSIGLMMGVTERPTITDDDKINPIEQYGLRLMSMSFLIEGDSAPVVLRGPMVTRYTQQFLRDVKWGELDVLLLDLPPGTGDIQLTIVQTVALAGAVVVTTPQEVALIDARKASSMFHKVSVPILGLVENMSYFLCPDNGKRYDIFGTGGGRREAERLGVPLLGEIPLDIPTRGAGDAGRPIVAADPENPVSRAFVAAAARLAETLRDQR